MRELKADPSANPCFIWAFSNVGKGTKKNFSRQIGSNQGASREQTLVN